MRRCDASVYSCSPCCSLKLPALPLRHRVGSGFELFWGRGTMVEPRGVALLHLPANASMGPLLEEHGSPVL